MTNTLQVADEGQHGKNGFDTHAFVPGSILTDFHVLWNIVVVSKTKICQGNGFTDKGLYHRMKMLIVDIHRCPIPVDDTAQVIQQHAKLDANAPPSLVATLFPSLLLAASFPNRKQQLNRVIVDHGHKGWIRQQ